LGQLKPDYECSLDVPLSKKATHFYDFFPFLLHDKLMEHFIPTSNEGIYKVRNETKTKSTKTKRNQRNKTKPTKAKRNRKWKKK
jgi:hypothetical protein